MAIMQKDMANDLKEMEARWAIRSNRRLSILSNTVISNKECQQRHQDQDAATRIQRIVCGFIQQKFNSASLKQESAVIIQVSLCGFIQQKFNFASLEQESAVIIQASLCGYSTRQRLHL
eukprot:7697291-Ditylum_brightwellii.AAC.1